jgi:hypothetical protein
MLPVHAVVPQQKATYKMTQNLEDQWLVYDASYKGYVPYFQKEYGVQPTLSLYLNLKKYSHYSLSIQVPQPTHLFVQSQLCRTLQPDRQLILNIDSLQKRYKLNSLLVTLYAPEGYAQLPTATIVYKNQETPTTQKSTTPQSVFAQSRQPQLRELSRFQDFVTVAIVFLLAFYTFLLNYHPKAFQRNFSFQAILTVDTREDATVIAKPLSQINLLFVLAHSMSLGLFYMIAQWYSESFFVNVLPINLSGSFGELVQYFLSCTGMIFLLLIIKYFFVYAIGVVFGINNAASVHYYEYLLFSRIFFLVVIPLQFIFMLSFPQLLVWFIQTIFVAVIILNIARMFVISSVLNKITSFRNLYLFSYLCATELIPLLIGIKFLAK